MTCPVQHQIAVYADLSVIADREEIVNEEAVKDFVVNHVAEFSNGEIELYQAQDYAKDVHASLYDSLVFRIIGGDEVAVKGLQHLMKASALEINELNGKRH